MLYNKVFITGETFFELNTCKLQYDKSIIKKSKNESKRAVDGVGIMKKISDKMFK